VCVRHVPLVHDLIRLGISLDTKDEDGQTALEYAVLCDNDVVLRLLLQAGANPHVDPELLSPRVEELIREVLDAKK
jgi:ankyrin repeat protein